MDKIVLQVWHNQEYSIDSWDRYDKEHVIHYAFLAVSSTLCGIGLSDKQYRSLSRGVSGKEITYFECEECHKAYYHE